MRHEPNSKSDAADRTEKPSGVETVLTESSDKGPMLASSRILGFAKLNSRGRLHALEERGLVASQDLNLFSSPEGLPLEYAESFIENCIGRFSLPLGIATNFLINGKELLVPMAVEESSVVAAASHGAKLARSGGGFFAEPTHTIATCQIQIKCPPEFSFFDFFHEQKEVLRSKADACHPNLLNRGGGVVDVELRTLQTPGRYVIHVHVDTKEAMGANIVNTVAEELGTYLSQNFKETGLEIGLKILTNLTTRRLTTVRCEILPDALAMAGFSGDEAINRIVEAFQFADQDPYRASTHNKGVMNGIDPVVIATGNDWRAVEAGCHAYAATRCPGEYKPLTHWEKSESGTLVGQITVPIAVGTVGGVTKLHPVASRCLKLLGNPSSSELSAIIASVGLAQNLSALRALACEGIQRGHMALHERNIEMLRRYDHLPQLTTVQNTAATERPAHPER